MDARRSLPLLALAALLAVPEPAAAKAAPRDPWWMHQAAPLRPLSSLTWLEGELAEHPDYRIAAERELPLLRRFANPKVERPGEWRTFWTGRYGFSTWWRDEPLAWSDNACEPPAERERPLFAAPSLAPVTIYEPPQLSGLDLSPAWVMHGSPTPELLLGELAPKKCEPWQRGVPVTIARHGAEHDSFRLLECDGSVALDALDRVSVLARPPGVARPELPLPLEPDPDAALRGEWVSGVRLLDPRLVWVLAVIADSFPGRPIYLISGYRADAGESFHKKGRALDLFVMGVPNESVFRVCRKLKDVACGFYPNGKFVHVDVRPPATGHALWVDVSRPGEPSSYVDSWPGVVEGGALQWAGAEQ